MATTKTNTRRKPAVSTQRRRTAAAAPAAKPGRRATAKSWLKKLDYGVLAIGGVAAVAGAGLAAFLFRENIFRPGNAEHDASDLMGDEHPGPDHRAPDAFRPDPTAPVPASEREGLRPATGPAPTLSANRGDLRSEPA